MPAGVAMDTLVERLRLETRDSPNPAHQLDWIAQQRHALRTAQEVLWMAHVWPALRFTATIDLAASQRTYDLPTGITWEGIRGVTLTWGGNVHELPFGASAEHYAAYDPDAGDTGSPAQRWDVIATDGYVTQIEVWPVPDANDQKLTVYGNRPLRPFSAADDLCTLDDTLIVLTAAAEQLEGRGAKDAQTKRAKAERYLQLLLGRSSKTALALHSFAQAPRRHGPGRLLAPY